MELVGNIKNKFNKLKMENPRVSLRSIAKKANVSPSHLSNILNGKSRVTRNKAMSILEALNVSEDEIYSILNSTKVNFHHLYLKNEVQRFEEAKDELSFVPDIYHRILMELAQCNVFFEDYRWLSEKMGCSEDVVRIKVNELLDAKIFIRDGRKLVRNIKNGLWTLYREGDVCRDEDLHSREYILQKALQIINYVKTNKTRYPQKNDISFHTIKIPKKRLEKAIDLIRVALWDIASQLAGPSQELDEEVYALMPVFVPLTGAGNDVEVEGENSPYH